MGEPGSTVVCAKCGTPNAIPARRPAPEPAPPPVEPAPSPLDAVPEPESPPPAERPADAPDGRPAPPKVRGVALVVILSIITLTVYWYVWLGKAFGELTRHQGKPIRTGWWALLLGLLALADVGARVRRVKDTSAALGGVAADEAPVPYEIVPALEFDDTFRLGIAVAVALLYWTLLIVHLLRLGGREGEATVTVSNKRSYLGVMVLIFGFLGLAGDTIPKAGPFIGMVALVLILVWTGMVQSRINRYATAAAARLRYTPIPDAPF